MEQQQQQIGPQPGPQTNFLTTSAQICIFGGSAGGGKSWGLLYEPLRNVTTNPAFAAVIFRRTTVSHRRPGATWDESMLMYGQVRGAEPTQHNLEWKFKGGGKVVLAHLEYDSTVLEWHSAQIPLIEFDELTEFTQHQFFYMLSRNRSLCGVPPYIRATCNPDANSWVADLISWWIDQDTGFPIPDRAGVVRWFLRVGDELIWRDHAEELRPELLGLPTHDKEGMEIPYMPKSMTFIPSSIYDNTILMRNNPEYLGNLLALPTVERERLLRGNWKIKPSAGLYFKRSWVTVIEPEQLPPLSMLTFKRGWDLAATEKTQVNNPDWTTGTKIAKHNTEERYYVMDHTYIQKSAAGVETHLKITAAGDTRFCQQLFPQDPGQAGKWQITYIRSKLVGYPVDTSPETGDKAVRFGPFSAQAQIGHVFVLKGAWNDRWFSVLEGFPDITQDDDVDSTSRAFNAFLDSATGMIDYYKQMADQLVKEKIERLGLQETPTLDNGGVRVKPPSNIAPTMLTDMKGRRLYAEPDGTFIVEDKHAQFLARSGFKRIEAEVIDMEIIRERVRAITNR